MTSREVRFVVAGALILVVLFVVVPMISSRLSHPEADAIRKSTEEFRQYREQVEKGRK